MTFPEWVASEATWFDRLRCQFFGHNLGALILNPTQPRDWKRASYCLRCGRQP